MRYKSAGRSNGWFFIRFQDAVELSLEAHMTLDTHVTQRNEISIGGNRGEEATLGIVRIAQNPNAE